MKIAVSTVRCPVCGAEEMHPDGDKLLVRGFKRCDKTGYWWSQCLVCAGYYDENLNVRPVGSDGINPDYDRKKGWF
jgi:hypothetical protein